MFSCYGVELKKKSTCSIILDFIMCETPTASLSADSFSPETGNSRTCEVFAFINHRLKKDDPAREQQHPPLPVINKHSPAVVLSFIAWNNKK